MVETQEISSRKDFTDQNINVLQSYGAVGEAFLPTYCAALAISDSVRYAEINTTQSRASSAIAYISDACNWDVLAVALHKGFAPYDKLAKIKEERRRVARVSGLDMADIGPIEMLRFIGGHELGHIKDRSSLSRHELKAVKDAEFATLPYPGLFPDELEAYLAQLTKKQWRNVVAQLGLKTQGIKKPAQLLHMHTAAYNSLPSERSADDFSGFLLHKTTSSGVFEPGVHNA